MFVPFIFDILNYNSSDLVYSWIFYKFLSFTKKIGSFVVAPENYYCSITKNTKKKFAGNCRDMEYTFPTNIDVKQSQKYQITNAEMEKIISHYQSAYDAIKNLCVRSDPYIEELISNRLDAIERDSGKKVEVIMIWVGFKSIYEVAKRRNIKVLLLELSTIRKPNYNTTLGYFTFQDKYDDKGCKQEYEKFLEEYETNPIPLLSRKELVSFFVSTGQLVCLDKMSMPEEFDLGISPGLKTDYFFDNFANEPIQMTIKKAKKLFSNFRVSVRFHPNYYWNLPIKNWNIDNSQSSFEWILKCRRIVTSISNVGFEAMLFGKTSYVLSQYMPYSFATANHLDYVEDGVVSVKFLNYMLFGYFVPWKLMFDEDYINWRLSNPSIMEIFKYHFQYLCNQKGIKGKVTFEKILRVVHHLSDEQIQHFEGIDPYLHNKRLEYALQDEKNQLQSKELEVEFYKKELFKIKESTSWKFTRPLRKLSSILKKKAN